MGNVNTRLVLKNFDDIKQVKKGRLPEREVRQVTVTATVDTGATTLIISKQIFQELGLDVMDDSKTKYANDTKEICKLTEPVEIDWENRSITLPALVVDDPSVVLLGVLPLEGMDLMVDPVNQKLVGVHGDRPMYCAKTITINGSDIRGW
jgi:clan AA aspartic protease